jgi:DNA-binding transcriptional MerR regulator
VLRSASFVSWPSRVVSCWELLLSWRRRSGTQRGRRYSARDIAGLRLIQRLSQDEGSNLEGIRRILSMQDDIYELRSRVEQLTALLCRRPRIVRAKRVHRCAGSAACILAATVGNLHSLFRGVRFPEIMSAANAAAIGSVFR